MHAKDCLLLAEVLAEMTLHDGLKKCDFAKILKGVSRPVLPDLQANYGKSEAAQLSRKHIRHRPTMLKYEATLYMDEVRLCVKSQLLDIHTCTRFQRETCMSRLAAMLGD